LNIPEEGFYDLATRGSNKKLAFLTSCIIIWGKLNTFFVLSQAKLRKDQ